MGATTIVVVIVGALLGTYLYVSALCYLADIIAQRKENLKQQAEEGRKKALRQALDQAEMMRKKEEQRRRQLIKARNERGITTPDILSARHRRQSRPKSAARARPNTPAKVSNVRHRTGLAQNAL